MNVFEILHVPTLCHCPQIAYHVMFSGHGTGSAAPHNWSRGCRWAVAVLRHPEVVPPAGLINYHFKFNIFEKENKLSHVSITLFVMVHWLICLQLFFFYLIHTHTLIVFFSTSLMWFVIWNILQTKAKKNVQNITCTMIPSRKSHSLFIKSAVSENNIENMWILKSYKLPLLHLNKIKF